MKIEEIPTNEVFAINPTNDDFQDMKKEFQEAFNILMKESQEYKKILKDIAEENIPVITNDHEAKWVYLKIATDLRDMARKATCNLEGEPFGYGIGKIGKND